MTAIGIGGQAVYVVAVDQRHVGNCAYPPTAMTLFTSGRLVETFAGGRLTLGHRVPLRMLAHMLDSD